MAHAWSWYVTNHSLSADARAGKLTFLARDDGEASAADQVKALSTDDLLSLMTWAPALQTWTYASSTTVYAAGNVTAIYAKGHKVKLTQSAATKYFYITDVSAYDSGNNRTTLTLFAGSNYTVANATISSPYYSAAAVVPGFPDGFAYAATLTGFSSNPSGAIYRFSLRGNRCMVYICMPNTGTSNSVLFYVSAPVAAKTITNMTWYGKLGMSKDNNTNLTDEGLILVNSAASTFLLYTSRGGGAWTASSGKSANGFIEYEWF